MRDALEVLAVLAMGAAAAFLITRFPDTRKKYGEQLDDALYSGVVRSMWYLILVAAIAVVALWLLR